MSLSLQNRLELLSIEEKKDCRQREEHGRVHMWELTLF